MKKFSLGALVAAGLLVGGLSAGSASAADLGGNCCADLEERIAELEATTARKGNRKVSLTISGWVAEQVMWWDDGEEQNVYVGGIGTTLASHFKFTGQATITPGWHAGYVIHVEVYGSETLTKINQNVATGPNLYDSGANFTGLNTLQSFWFIKSDHLGKLSVGKQSQASDNTAILPDGSGSLVPANFVFFDYGGFFLRNNNGTLSGTSIAAVMGCTDCNGLTTNNVRYDSPTFAGFSVSASWGEDDFWDVAARYAGEYNGIKVAAAAAYSVSNSPGIQGVTAGSAASVGVGLNNAAPTTFPATLAKSVIEETEFFQVGAYAEHTATGLFIYGAYGQLEADLAPGVVAVDDHDFWYLKAGLRERWTPLGHTVLYGEYEESNDGGAIGSVNTAAVFNVSLASSRIVDSETTLWGFGVVQEIDAAAMSIWLSYRNIEADFTRADGTTSDFDDFQYVKAGALINF